MVTKYQDMLDGTHALVVAADIGASADEPIPIDVPILAQLNEGGIAACYVDENGMLWQHANGAGSVGTWTVDDVTRYVVLEDVLDRIEEVPE